MKDFDEWNEIKKKTELETKRFYKVREIWWCIFGVNIGTEQDGKGKLFLRPVLILRSFGHNSCAIVPLTTSVNKHYFRISIGEINGLENKVNISQIKTIDTRRLVEKIKRLDVETFKIIIKSVKNLF